LTVRLNMINSYIKKQITSRPLYSKPSFEIVEISREDIVKTSLKDEGVFDASDLGGSLEWYE